MGTTIASGTFEVKLSPLPPYAQGEEQMLGRMSLDKEFQGDLEALSKGEMLSADTTVKGSAAYVAIERVTGALHGKRGSFTLQHSAIMIRGIPGLCSVSVVPDSATDELVGLSGRMIINSADGMHSYDFEYAISETAESNVGLKGA
jgi:hypothetical protein